MNKILIIAPHMDDEVLGMGGTICKFGELNYLVKVIFVCNRAYGHKYVAGLLKEQEQNALAVKKILGYQEHNFCRLNDEKLDGHLIDVIITIEKEVAQFQPQIIYLPYAQDSNQDHRAVADAAMVVLRTFSVPIVKEIYEYETASSTEQSQFFTDKAFVPNTYINITPFIVKKKKALRCYKKENREFPHPRSEKAIEILAAKRGTEAYLPYAEAFRLLRRIER